MSDASIDVSGLEQQLGDLAVADGEAMEVLLRLADVIFPDRSAIGDPARTLWPERGQRGQAAVGAGNGLRSEKELEAQIRESEARFRSLVEQLPAVVFYAALGDEDNEIYVSPQVEALLGFTQKEWLTNPLLWYTQLHPDDHGAVIEAFTKGVQTGGPFRAEVRFLARDGEAVWILGEARLIRDAAKRPAYFQGVAFDITPAKRAQEAMAAAEREKSEAAHLRADAFAARNVELVELNEQLRVARDEAEAAALARSTFLSTMSHELRTPLNSVIVLAGLLADDGLTAGQADMVRRMRLASDHLLELINDVLEFSRLRAGQVEVEQQTFDIERWLSDTIEIAAPRAAEKSLELRYRVAAGVPPRVTADQGRLRQILINLLGNAIKFTTEGHVEVTVKGQPVDRSTESAGHWELECSVRDTGVGIRPETAAMLFDEFRQADSGVSREFGGTGLGLAICKRLCELMGGRIWVESGAAGPGAILTFTWLASAAPAAPVVAQPSGADVVDSPGDELRVLVVDDDVMNQEVALLLLGSMGNRAEVVSSGDEAIAAVVRKPYDVVLMDVSMPAIDGLSATRAIRRLGPAIHQPYVVALTANALPGDSERCLAAGMNGYVAKPIDRGELSRALAAGGRARSGLVPPPGTPPAGAPPPAPVVDRPGFDRSVPLRILEEFGAEPLHRLTALFEAAAPRLAGVAVAAVAAGDADEAQRAVHTLKSSAASMGAVALSAACAEIETLVRTGHLDEVGPRTDALSAQVAAALKELAAIDAADR